MLSNKNRFTLFLVVVYSLFAAAFSACSESDYNSLESNPVEIVVSTGFGSASGVETRGIGSIHTNGILTNGPLPLSVVRIDQSGESDGSYLPYTSSNTDGVGQAPRRGRLEKFNLDIRMNFDTDEYYLSRAQNNKTKLIAWYPSVDEGGSVWGIDGSKATVEFTVDGETDILISNLVEGNKEKPYTGDSDNKMMFKHLLTRFRVRVYTHESEVEDFFGGVKSIVIAGKAQSCTVQLPDVGALNNTDPSDIKFDGDGVLPIIYKDPANNNPIEGYDNDAKALHIPLIGTDTDKNDSDTGLAGYAMVAPEASEITLLVETEERAESTVKIKAPDGGFVAGSSYTLAIEFRTKGLEIMSVTIHDWVTDEIIKEEI